MVSAVVPARNVQSSIQGIIRMLSDAGIDVIVVVANGCTDNTTEAILKGAKQIDAQLDKTMRYDAQPNSREAAPPKVPKAPEEAARLKLLESDKLNVVVNLRRFRKSQLILLAFKDPLGPDVPRAVGAAAARVLGASTVLFVDGDTTGHVASDLAQLICSVENDHTDLALSDCRPSLGMYSGLAGLVYKLRKRVAEEVGMSELGTASPSHGPHAISRKLLHHIPLERLAVPPAELVFAALEKFHVKAVVRILHDSLGNPAGNRIHATLMAETIIGDCLEAIRMARGMTPSRTSLDDPLYEQYSNKPSWDGYNSLRRFDILSTVDQILGSSAPSSGRTS